MQEACDILYCDMLNLPSISDPERLSKSTGGTIHTHTHGQPCESHIIKAVRGQMLRAGMVGLLYRGTLFTHTHTGPAEDSLSGPCRQTPLDFPRQMVNGNLKYSDVFLMC